MARSHRMTPKRRAALKKAQAASARKRRGKGKGKLAAANRKRSPSRGQRAASIALAGLAVANVAYQAHSWRRANQRRTMRFNEQTRQIHGSIDREIAGIQRQARHARMKLRGIDGGRPPYRNGPGLQVKRGYHRRGRYVL